ncbi:helix-turn-helix transcriptional regulator [Adlercreutzia sp. ZJ242]|uniref:helix-turn-helix domain-containing protein n=1 Tax=Adlercreutzia sp. ZJ242 TaxID=2709409 RepID=UPI0013EDC90F|nr:helix-turn-helix transcriptional regulator [Adlercreutzia sp. ZJ242]
MKFVEALSSIMQSKNVTKAELARRRGVKPQSVNTMFSTQKKVSVELAVEMARVLDYRIVLMPCDKKMPAGSFEIEG